MRSAAPSAGRGGPRQPPRPPPFQPDAAPRPNSVTRPRQARRFPVPSADPARPAPPVSAWAAPSARGDLDLREVGGTDRMHGAISGRGMPRPVSRGKTWARIERPACRAAGRRRHMAPRTAAMAGATTRGTRKAASVIAYPARAWRSVQKCGGRGAALGGGAQNNLRACRPSCEFSEAGLPIAPGPGGAGTVGSPAARTRAAPAGRPAGPTRACGCPNAAIARGGSLPSMGKSACSGLGTGGGTK